MQAGEQKENVSPWNWATPRALAGSTVMPQTGSVAVSLSCGDSLAGFLTGLLIAIVPWWVRSASFPALSAKLAMHYSKS